jgi:serine/threonine protein kinase
LVSPGHNLVIPELAAFLKSPTQDFTVHSVLAGGMAECLRISQGGNTWALKIIQSRLLEDEDAWKRYLREIRIWSTVSACEGVVEALCAVRVNGLPAVCSAWMKGGDLARHLSADSAEFFFSTMARIVGTLSWVHTKHGIIHRDLKPGNILLDETGRAFVSDWGLARPLTRSDSPIRTARKGATCDPGLTQAGTNLCTIAYASPEQIVGSSDLDHRSDIYSLGVLMYEWETGRRPFSGTSNEIALMHVFERPKKIGGLFQRTKFGVEDLILQCLEKDPSKRPATYGELDSALARAAQRRGVPYTKYVPQLRYEMPMIGVGELDEHLRSSSSVLWSADRTYAVMEGDDTDKYLQEAGVLMATGDYGQAERIYAGFFIRDMVLALPDFPLHQLVTVNYSHCLTERGRHKEAIKVLQALANARHKSAEYFINLSYAQIRDKAFADALQTAQQGLNVFPNDSDLRGNLLTAQTQLDMFVEAAETAKVRLGQVRDVSSLLEVALLHSNYADTLVELDWPLAVRNYSYAVQLLSEAKTLNARDLRVRLQLAIVLERMGAYLKCTEQVAALLDMQLTMSNRLLAVYLHARCLDRVGAYAECAKFCDGWLKGIGDAPASSSISEFAKTRIERVRAVTVSDGFSLGMMDGDRRVIYRGLLEFFAQVVGKEKLRENSDFCYLARHHEWMEQFEAAYAVLAAAEELYPEYWEVPFRKAEFLDRSGEHGAALESAERATVLAPGGCSRTFCRAAVGNPIRNGHGNE